MVMRERYVQCDNGRAITGHYPFGKWSCVIGKKAWIFTTCRVGKWCMWKCCVHVYLGVSLRRICSIKKDNIL